MKAEDQQFSRIVNGASQYVIPVFQRDYSWQDEDCDQLWADIVRIGGDAAGRARFISSLVYAQAGDASAALMRWLLIDGQQRLTTLTLILAALRPYIKHAGWTGPDADSPTARRIEAYFLGNTEQDGERQHKLVLRRNDHEALELVLDGGERPPASRSLTIVSRSRTLIPEGT